MYINVNEIIPLKDLEEQIRIGKAIRELKQRLKEEARRQEYIKATIDQIYNNNI